MKKILFRVLANIVDITIVSAIVSVFALLMPFMNRDKINEITEDYNNFYVDVKDAYEEIKDDKGILSDDVITTEELNEFSKKYDKKYDEFFEKYVNKELKEDNDKDDMYDKFIAYCTDYINKKVYEITKLNLVNYIIQVVLVVLYFGVLQFFLKGRTIGKKLLRLQVVDNEDETKEISIGKYLVRSLFVTTTVFSVINSVLALTLKENTYLGMFTYYNYIVQAYALIMLMFILFRDDQKGFHDLLLGTRVKLYNKDGSEYISTMFKTEEEVVEEKVKEVEFKEKKTTKKTTPKKKGTTKKKNEKSSNKTN